MTEIPADALRVVATIPVDPTRASEVAAAFATLAEASRGEEGCYQYEVYESTAEPGTFVTVEAWRAQADLDAHFTMPHMATASAVFGPAILGTVAIHPLTAI